MWARLVCLALLLAALPTSTQAAADELITRNEWEAQKAKEKRDPPIKTGKFDDNTVKAENVMTPRAPALYLTVHGAR